MDNFIAQTFGVSPTTFAIVVVFWAFVFVMLLGDVRAATFTTCIFAFITAWLIGKLGVVLFILLVVAIIGVGIYFLFKDGGRSTTPNYQTTTTPNYSSFSGSTSYSTGPSYQNSAKLPPTVLYHGTKTLKAATDILTHNRWLTKSHYPQGVYLSDDFDTAMTYTGFNGVVVEVNSFITSDMIVEHYQTPLTSEQLLAQGYRLIRDGKTFIAPTPANTNGRYIRIQGLVPVRLLDRNRNPISSTFK